MLTLKVVKAPTWLTKGIDLQPYMSNALESIGAEMEKRQGRGLGARRNQLTRQRSFTEQRVFSTMHHPRQTGAALKKKDEGRFKGMAPRVVKKYIIQPLMAVWAS